LSRQPLFARPRTQTSHGSGTSHRGSQVVTREGPRSPGLPLSPALRIQQARELTRRLDPLISGSLQITITDNRSVMISVQRDVKRQAYRVRLHHLFVDAPPAVLRTLSHYIMLGDRKSSRDLNAFIDERQDRIREPEGKESRPQPIRTRGRIYDLREIFDDLNDRYFEKQVSARISWGRNVGRGRARASIKVGSFIVELNLIRIHPGLDQRWIPRFYIEWVVFHEMLHSVHPIPRVNGRRQFHTPEFEMDERRFEHYELATLWEKRNLAALLRI